MRAPQDDATSVTRPVRLLVVCHANVTRSIVAGELLARAAQRRGLAMEVRTAGTHAIDGQAVSLRTREAIAEVLDETIDLGAHRSRPLDADDVAWADVVVAMEAAQVSWLRGRYADAAGRTATLGYLVRSLPAGAAPLVDRLAQLDLAGCEPDPVDDVGGDHAAYVATVRQLTEQCDALVARLGG